MSELKIVICGDVSVTPESAGAFEKGDSEGASAVFASCSEPQTERL